MIRPDGGRILLGEVEATPALGWFVSISLVEGDDVREKLARHIRGFSIDASVRIPAWEGTRLERLLSYSASR